MKGWCCQYFGGRIRGSCLKSLFRYLEHLPTGYSPMQATFLSAYRLHSYASHFPICLQATFLSPLQVDRCPLSLYIYISSLQKKSCGDFWNPIPNKHCYIFLQQTVVYWYYYFFLWLQENSRLEFPSLGGEQRVSVCPLRVVEIGILSMAWASWVQHLAKLTGSLSLSLSIYIYMLWSQ